MAPMFFGKLARFRFDDPQGEFGVLYAGGTEECAFIETFGHATGVRAVTRAELAARTLSIIRVNRPLNLVDLTGRGLAALGADNRLCSGGGYKTAQAWSAALHAHPSAPDGLLYRPAHDPSQEAVAIFDRAAAVCSATAIGSLNDHAQRHLLARMLNHYQFGLIP